MRLTRDRNFNASVVGVMMLLGLASTGTGFFAYRAGVAPVARALEVVQIGMVNGAPVTWGEVYGRTGLGLYIKCRMDAQCRSTLRHNPPLNPLLWGGGAGLLLFMGAALVSASLRRRGDQLDTARLLRVDPYDFPSVTELVEGKKNRKGEVEDPVVAHFGYVIEELPRPTKGNPGAPIRYRYGGLKKIGVTSKMLHEHMMIYGPTGSGKTSRGLMPLLLGFAERGDAVVLPDFKYPDPSEGLMEAVSLFHRLGRRVWALTPFDAGGTTIPLFDFIKTPKDARDLAAVLLPSDEYNNSSADFYTFVQQRMLGAVLLSVAYSLTPNWAEVVRICSQDLEEMQKWLATKNDPQLLSDLLRVTKDQKLAYGGFIAGIKNAIEPFELPAIARTFVSVPERNFDVREFLEEGGLFYLGFPSDEMRSKRGEILMRIVNDWLISQAVRVRVEDAKRGIKNRDMRLVYDEAGNLGKMRWLLKDITTVRSKNISFVIGIQNEGHMELVYSPQQWEAITQNIGTHLVLPSGLKNDAAAQLSKDLGEREMYTEGKSETTLPGSWWLNGLTSGGYRSGRNVSVQKRPLFTQSQISEWPRFLGIYRPKGDLPPALLGTLPVYDPWPEFVGLDGERFKLDNRELAGKWRNIMDDLSPLERAEEIAEIMFGKGEDDIPLMTARDVLVEWVENLVGDGVEFLKRGGVYRVHYLTFDSAMRGEAGEKAIMTFIESGWVQVEPGTEESPSEWDWLDLTRAGLDTIGRYGERAVQASSFTSHYVAARKRLSQAAPDLAAFEVAREVLPIKEVLDITRQLVRLRGPTLENTQVERATALMMENFPTQANGMEVVASVPLSLRFEKLLDQAIEAAGGAAAPESVAMEGFFTQGDGRVQVNLDPPLSPPVIGSSGGGAGAGPSAEAIAQSPGDAALLGGTLPSPPLPTVLANPNIPPVVRGLGFDAGLEAEEEEFEGQEVPGSAPGGLITQETNATEAEAAQETEADPEHSPAPELPVSTPAKRGGVNNLLAGKRKRAEVSAPDTAQDPGGQQQPGGQAADASARGGRVTVTDGL